MKLRNFKVNQEENFKMSFGDSFNVKEVNNVEKKYLMLLKKKIQLKLPLSENEKKIQGLI
jgi:hypothetical protein